MSETFPAAFAQRSLVAPPGVFRLILAAAVVVSHLSGLDVGRLAVIAFFYLSGYWTTRIWDEKFSGRRTLRFYAARYLRVAPLYLLVVCVAALALKRPLHPESFSLLGVATAHQRDPIAVAWSLDIELQFYLLLPLVIGLVLRFPARWIVAAALVAAVLGVWIEARLGVVTAAKYAPAFVLGVLTHTARWRPDARTANLSLAAFLAMTLITAFTPFLDKRSPDPFDRDLYGFVWLLPLLPWVARSLTIRSSRLDRHLGNLSYPLYLVHWPVIALMLPHMGHGLPAKLTAAAAALGVAVVLYRLVDRPIDAWRVRLTETGPAAPAGRQPPKPVTADLPAAVPRPAASLVAVRVGELRRTFADEVEAEPGPDAEREEAPAHGERDGPALR